MSKPLRDGIRIFTAIWAVILGYAFVTAPKANVLLLLSAAACAWIAINL